METLDKDECKTLNKLVAKLNIKFQSIDEKLSVLDDVKDKINTLTEGDVLKNTVKEATEASKLALAAVKSIQSNFDKLSFEYQNVRKENDELRAQVINNDNYVRRKNLVIRGIKETDGENCENLFKQFLKNKLQLSDEYVTSVKFERCHRLGKINEDKKWSRPMIIRFCHYEDRKTVWEKRHTLANTPYSLNENFCYQTEFNRKKLYPIYRKAKSMDEYKNKISLVADRLIIDGTIYSVNSIDRLPSNIHPKNFTRKCNDSTLVFGGVLSEYDCLSNWAPSPIVYNEEKYSSVEQAYMKAKAKSNNDHIAEKSVMFTDNPREIKRIGAAIKVRDKWIRERKGIMLNIVRAKFSQNDTMRKSLLDTGHRKLGETGSDQYYSTGLPLTHRDVLKSDTWKGESQLGKILEIVRNELQ